MNKYHLAVLVGVLILVTPALVVAGTLLLLVNIGIRIWGALQ